MDMFVISMLAGGGGLLAMAIGGLSHQSHGSHDGGGHGGHGHDGGGHGHGGPGGNGHGAGHGMTGAAHSSGVAHSHGHDGALTQGASWLLSTPRILFSVLLGLGATGLVLDSVLRGAVLVAAAVVGGIVFERFIITPIWNFSMRFASKPALMLESALLDEATAVTSFNRDGEGIVSIELDGQIVQILARLRPADRALSGSVRAGQRVRIEEVNSAQNRCTVSVL